MPQAHSLRPRHDRNECVEGGERGRRKKLFTPAPGACCCSARVVERQEGIAGSAGCFRRGVSTRDERQQRIIAFYATKLSKESKCRIPTSQAEGEAGRSGENWGSGRRHTRVEKQAWAWLVQDPGKFDGARPAVWFCCCPTCLPLSAQMSLKQGGQARLVTYPMDKGHFKRPYSPRPPQLE
ncbi:hypothetical protein VTK73DRAFT_4473 [Phialemonium thermophilum]|uniref:Uncharacterized protein n=1 Tax=Phialemonium thermophilum TaxID=223376 RepID=A0ABR3V8E4_9PEZI